MFNEKFFSLAFDLAETARGTCSPNPFVGAVLVADGQVVGKGVTQCYGQDHAEVQAIKDAGAMAKAADMYVTLEPCSHYGKTPPCAKAIIECGIRRVYAGITDPNPLVNGQGFAMLKNAGIEVQTNIWADKIHDQLEYYLTYITGARPFVFLKAAASLDGNIATLGGESKWITGKESRIYVHTLRAQADVLISGIGTVIADNPLFSVRPPSKGTTPWRIILDSHLQIPLDAQVLTTSTLSKISICTADDYHDADKENTLKACGIEIIKLKRDKYGLSLLHLLKIIYKANKYSVMVEAGSRLASSFLTQNLIDKLYYFIAPKILGGGQGVFASYQAPSLAEAIKFNFYEPQKIGEDFLLIGLPGDTKNGND